jgi:putative iron-regulated protein
MNMKPLRLQIQAGKKGNQPSCRRVQHPLAVRLGSLCACFLLLPIPWGSGADPGADWLKLKRAVVTNHADLVSATYQDSLAAVRKLQHAIDALLAKPSGPSLDAARAAWLAARVPYCQTEVCRFYDGPIDQVEGMVNAWPIDENYIDYVADDPNAGVINAVSNFPALSRELIVSLNEKEGKKNISTGFHALEFLLWGQDLNPTGPGNRPWRDFTAGARHGDRRRQYLRIVAELLVEHLETVTAAWAVTDHPNYRSEFLAMDSDVALANILKGMGALSGPELAGERLTVPYETKEQEDEQSCFSDNTRNDLLYDAVGIQNVYLGRYLDRTGRKIEGPGVHDLLLRLDPELATKLAAQIETTVACTRSIPQPFDQVILGPSTSPGRLAVKQAATSSQTQSDMIAKAANVLAIKLNL